MRHGTSLVLEAALSAMLVLALACSSPAHNWEAEFTNWSGTNASSQSACNSSTGGTVRSFYVSHTAGTTPGGTWLSQSSATYADFNISATGYFRARLALYMEDSVRCDTGAAVGWRMNVVNTSNVNRGPFQFALTDGAGTEYTCYIVLVGGNQLIIKQNSGSQYSAIDAKSVSITGWHDWTLTVKKLDDGNAHWRLLCDGTQQSFTGANGTHTTGGVTYSFLTASNTYDVPTGERNQYIGLGELSTSYPIWAHQFDWVRWTDSGPSDPVVTQHPSNQTKNVGETATFSIMARSFGTIGYQWQVYSGGSWGDISSATNASYTTPSLTAGDNGKQYRCRVSNDSTAGTDDIAYSNAATLTVIGGGPNAPSNPGTTSITTSSITWTWQDNSADETGFKVYADPGAGPPSTLRITTGVDAAFWDYTGLSANTQHAFQVAATNAGGDSSKTSNFAKYTLALAPTFGSSGDGKVNCDKGAGSGSTWYPGGTTVTLTAVNGFGAGQSTASKYQYVWNTSPSEPSWSGAPEWTSGSLPKTESSAGSYYMHLRACNGDGSANTTSLTLGPYQIDATAPSTPVVTDDGLETASMTEIHATWSATDEQSGIAEYHYAVSTTQSESGIITGGEWQSAGINTEGTRSGLSLTPGQTYYVLVKAKNGAGEWSGIGASDGITVIQADVVTPLSMPNLRLGGGDWFYDPDTHAGQRGVKDGAGTNNIGMLVRTWGEVTFAESDHFYLDDGSMLDNDSVYLGVKVQAAGFTIPEQGSYVAVTGVSLCYKVGSDLYPMIQVRRQADIVPIQ